ncbi:MAG: hypothetical protein ACLUSP_11410 [Christensenellales bacterium]
MLRLEAELHAMGGMCYGFAQLRTSPRSNSSIPFRRQRSRNQYRSGQCIPNSKALRKSIRPQQRASATRTR